MRIERLLLTIGLSVVMPISLGGESRTLPAAHPPEAILDELDEVLITGQQPGPKLWQVKSGDHVLWILAHPQLIPEKLKWRSKHVEKVLAGASEVLVPYGGPDPTPQSVVEKAEQKNALATYQKGRYLPAGRTLRDILSPENYARYEATLVSFSTKDKDAERLSPGHATNLLLNRAAHALKITHPLFAPISTQVVDMAARRNIKVTRVDFPQTGEESRKYLADALVDTCPLENLLAQLDDGGAGWKALANAWSAGDMSKLRRLMPLYGRVVVNGPFACKDGVDGSETARKIQAANARSTQTWLAAMERALRANASTLAVVEMPLLFASEGPLEALRSRGYEVVEP